MAIQTSENPYQGVNAHLNSLLQTPGETDNPSMWRSFHNAYIVSLTASLKAQLPPGYIAVNDQSLQILSERDGGLPIPKSRIPDVAVFEQRNPQSASSQLASTSTGWTWEATIEETLAPDNSLSAVVIYRQVKHKLLGTPVTYIELLSPSNKPGGPNFDAYSSKRSEVLLDGIPLVEIDFLHEQPSPIRGLPTYPHQPGSYAYYLALSDPSHDKSKGPVRAKGFGVNQAIPAIEVPLADEARISLEFDPAYQTAFNTGPWEYILDYGQLPSRFETYSPADQQRIRVLMQSLAA